MKPTSDYPPVAVRVKYDPESKLMQYPVEKLPLNQRAENVLGRLKIRTVGQVLAHWDEIYDWKNVGVLTGAQIKAAVFALLCKKANHVDLAMELPPADYKVEVKEG